MQQGVRHRPVQALPGTVQYSTVPRTVQLVRTDTTGHQSSFISMNLVKQFLCVNGRTGASAPVLYCTVMYCNVMYGRTGASVAGAV